MTHSQQLRDFVAAWEALHLAAYNDGVGVATIGWGHIRGVSMGDRCTLEQAQAWLDEELASAAADVVQLVHVPLEQWQFDAIVSLTFNVGASKLAGSQLMRCVNGAENDAAVVQFLRWAKGGGKYMRGLLARRAGEGLMYALGQYDAR